MASWKSAPTASSVSSTPRSRQTRKVAVRDGEIITACQEACPTSAITFGNINDPAAKVNKLKKEERSYQVLADLNYRPRTSYIAGVTNPNPELETAETA